MATKVEELADGCLSAEGESMIKKDNSLTINGERFEVTTFGETGDDRFIEVKTPEEHRFFVPIELWDMASQHIGAMKEDPAQRMENIIRSFGPSLLGPEQVEERSTFVDELRALINRHSAENGSDTPDYILAEFLVGCLAAFDRTVRDRERWHGRTPSTWEKSGFLPRTIGRARGETADEQEPDRG